MAAPRPSFAAAADAHAVRLEPGKSADLKVTVTPVAGYAGALKLVAAGLPDGITAAATEVPAKGGAVAVSSRPPST